jgi:hypothetical protein
MHVPPAIVVDELQSEPGVALAHALSAGAVAGAPASVPASGDASD